MSNDPKTPKRAKKTIGPTVSQNHDSPTGPTKPPELKEEKVGYCSPPKSGRFRSGKSGNPSGRKKKPLSVLQQIDTIMNQKITVTEGGKKKRITRQELMIRGLANKAATGEGKAVLLLEKLKSTHHDSDSPDIDSSLLEADDRATINAFINSQSFGEVVPDEADDPVEQVSNDQVAGTDIVEVDEVPDDGVPDQEVPGDVEPDEAETDNDDVELDVETDNKVPEDEARDVDGQRDGDDIEDPTSSNETPAIKPKASVEERPQVQMVRKPLPETRPLSLVTKADDESDSNKRKVTTIRSAGLKIPVQKNEPCPAQNQKCGQQDCATSPNATQT